MDYLLWKNANFSFSYIHISIVWKGLFSNEKVTKYSFSVYFDWNETLKNLHIFHQNHRLTLLEKGEFNGFLKGMFS